MVAAETWVGLPVMVIIVDVTLADTPWIFAVIHLLALQKVHIPHLFYAFHQSITSLYAFPIGTD